MGEDMTTIAGVSRSEMDFVLPTALSDLRVHMVGIGGSGMSGLAAFLLRRGAFVSGTDAGGGAPLARLGASGAQVSAQPLLDNLVQAPDLVVRSAAVPDDDAEILAARGRGVPILKYAQMLGLLMGRCAGIAISGTHGKSTTTAWLSFVLRRAGFDPSFVVGANVPQLGGGSGVGDGAYFVAEACEYDRSFLNLRPTRTAILNIEEDHLDYYENLDAIVEAFTEFTSRLPPDGLLLVNQADERCRRVAAAHAGRLEFFGSGPDAEWRAVDIALEDGRYGFAVLHRGARLGRVRLGLPGRHNVDNALAVIALARDCDVPWGALAPALEEFRGAQRRLELRGEVRGVRILDDYGHHPTEIRATLVAARERFAPRQLWCIFQPHQHSRTRFLMNDFARSFHAADHVVVPDIYFVRDTQRERELVCAEDLVAQLRARGANAEYIPEFAGIVERVAAAVQPGDVVLTMGAGNIWMVADVLLRRLGGDLPG